MTKVALDAVTRFCQSGLISRLESAILLYRQVIHQCGRSDSKRFVTMYGLADAYVSRWFHSRQSGDLDEAVVIFQDCLQLRPAPHPGPRLQARLCACLAMKSLLTGDTDVFAEASLLHFRHEKSHREDTKAWDLAEQAAEIGRKFISSGDLTDLDSVLLLSEKAVSMIGEEDPLRYEILKLATVTVLLRFRQTGQGFDLDRAILLLEETMPLLPATDEGGSSLLREVGNALVNRFEHTTQALDLEKAISMTRKALILLPAPHPDRSTSLNNLASAVQTRFEQTGQVADLEEAISLYRESLMLHPASHPHRSTYLNNLASAVQTRFEQTG